MISSLKNNNRRKNRDSVFEKGKNQTNSSFGEFTDHKQMNTYEYAAFQKKVFKEKNKIINYCFHFCSNRNPLIITLYN